LEAGRWPRPYPWRIVKSMRFRFFAWAVLSTAAGLAALLACGAQDKNTVDPPEFRDDDSGTTTRPRTDSGVDPPPPPADGGSAPSRIYAHTKDTLYLFDTATKTPTMVGKLGCVPAGDSVLDIALDRTGAMYGTTYQRFISIDPITASCVVVLAKATYDEYPNSLSFVPAGTVDATKEALVGYVFNGTNGRADHYVRIDTSTGAITDVGDLNPLGPGIAYAASGDLISLIQASNKTYLTVKKFEADGGLVTTTDYLAEVNPTTGQLVKVLGPTSQTLLYGLGYWAAKP
jgi:hypothetical protein